MSARDKDAIVVGGGIGGLVAAVYLARAGVSTLLVEASDRLGGRAQNVSLTAAISAPLVADTLYALDAQMLSELRLEENGLAFAQRDMKLVSLRPGGRHLVLPRPMLAATGAIHGEASADSRAYWRYRSELFALARRMRPLWTQGALADGPTAETTPETLARQLHLSAADEERLELFLRSSANAYLARWFETDALKAALAADACVDGFSPEEAGSALSLLWRAAQTGCGRQAAVCQLAGGPMRLAEVLAATARASGAELRCGERGAQILVADGRAAGVRLAGGEELGAAIVISGIGARRTLAELVPPAALPFGLAARLAESPRVASARLLLALDGTPPFAGVAPLDLQGRLILAARPESGAEAKSAALVGALPTEPVLELTIPTLAEATLDGPDRHALSVRIPYVPYAPDGGWGKQREVLKKRVMASLESYAPGLSDRVTAALLLTPEDLRTLFGAEESGTSVRRLLLPYAARIRTPLKGLYLCGSDAEPFDVISGRAGRLAASIARAEFAP
jgi:phytoene dehydrogenase-like protein